MQTGSSRVCLTASAKKSQSFATDKPPNDCTYRGCTLIASTWLAESGTWSYVCAKEENIGVGRIIKREPNEGPGSSHGQPRHAAKGNTIAPLIIGVYASQRDYTYTWSRSHAPSE